MIFETKACLTQIKGCFWCLTSFPMFPALSCGNELKRRKGNDANHISLKKYFRKHYTLHAVYIWIRSLALLVPCVYFSADLSLINSFFITSVMSEMTEHFCVVQYPDLVNLITWYYMIDDFLTQSNSGLLLFVHHFGFLWSSLCSLTSTRNRFSVILTPRLLFAF